MWELDICIKKFEYTVFFYKSSLYKNGKPQKTLKIKNLLRTILRLACSHLEFTYCHSKYNFMDLICICLLAVKDVEFLAINVFGTNFC